MKIVRKASPTTESRTITHIPMGTVFSATFRNATSMWLRTDRLESVVNLETNTLFIAIISSEVFSNYVPYPNAFINLNEA